VYEMTPEYLHRYHCPGDPAESNSFLPKDEQFQNNKWKTYTAITLSNCEDFQSQMVSFHSTFVYIPISHLTTTNKFVQWDSRVHHSNENITPVTWIYRHFSYSLNTKVWRSSNTPISEGILPERSLASASCQSRDYWMRIWYCWLHQWYPSHT